jgi:hypothetical protein
MKKVVTHSEVAHMWANQTQEEARTPHGNFYFYGKTIYSYGRHFPIATLIDDTVILTERSYSNTTAGHVQDVRRAASHKPQILCYEVPDTKKDTSAHEKNFERWAQDVRENVKSLERARKPEIYVGNIQRTIEKVEKYCKFFNLKLTAAQKVVFTLRETANYKELLALEAHKKQLFEKNIRSTGAKVYEQSIAAWKQGSETNFRKQLTERQKNLLTEYTKLTDRNTTFLRVTESEVETSKSIRLPFEVAERYYRWYRATAAKGGCNGECNYEILGYSVTEASEARLVVGCHDISRAEIDALAAALKW